MSKKRGLVFGVGVNDWGASVVSGGKFIPEYQLWKNTLKRCFNDNYKQKHPTYKDVVCCNDWLSMKKFIQDVSQMKGYGFDGWQIDKDILSKGNLIYSKETCCFVPKEVNILMINRENCRGEYPVGVSLDRRVGRFLVRLRANGMQRSIGVFDTPEEAFQAYKVAKEAHIKVVAEKWRYQLDERVYRALINYVVDIDD